MPASSVTVRMYDVGFGDAFLITVTQDDQAWRMLVDCGVHSQGKARPLLDVVRAIVSDLTEAAAPGTPPTLDVVVATHHHADHITGFAYDDWDKVHVGEVWVSFVEDDSDDDAKTLKNGLARAAKSLNTLIGRAPAALNDETRTLALGLAHTLALNSLGNEDAMDRLLGRNNKHFLNVPKIRYLPDKFARPNVIRTSLPEVNVHVLGPSRDPDQLKRMNPPTSARWLAMQQALDAEPASESAGDQTPAKPIFDEIYTVTPDEVSHDIGIELVSTLATLNLPTLVDDTSELLAAASILERSVNNTSIFFVLDVDGTRLVFVGDSQQGAWDHILQDPAARALVSEPAFYKIGHHGSHNATPRDYVTNAIGNHGTYAMLPYGKVEQWGDIPNETLLTALTGLNTHIVRADTPVADARVHVGPGNLWSEITFPAI
ncbi:MBL fold metallo-hydrolase [Pseudarthrobacter sp. S9]|uniref:MBL fold metallo-hydrolase n=1 Tax=Pseudarthrobacter sp. S9 TaxID=3418421 RepID=UPI003CFE045E